MNEYLESNLVISKKVRIRWMKGTKRVHTRRFRKGCANAADHLKDQASSQARVLVLRRHPKREELQAGRVFSEGRSSLARLDKGLGSEIRIDKVINLFASRAVVRVGGRVVDQGGNETDRDLGSVSVDCDQAVTSRHDKKLEEERVWVCDERKKLGLGM